MRFGYLGTSARRYVGTILLSFSVAMSAWACPLCKEGLFSPGESAARSGAAQGYAWSIALLLGVPLAMLIGISALIARAGHRRAMRSADSGTKLRAT